MGPSLPYATSLISRCQLHTQPLDIIESADNTAVSLLLILLFSLSYHSCLPLSSIEGGLRRYCTSIRLCVFNGESIRGKSILKIQHICVCMSQDRFEGQMR